MPDAHPKPLDAAALDTLFREARTYRAWREEPVSDALLRDVYDLAKFGPTASNWQPVRIVFVRSPEAKERLRPCLAAGNVPHTMAAPATAIFAYDIAFYERVATIAPHIKDVSGYAADPTGSEELAFRSGSLQAAYFILAARASGLSCGPMSGFDRAKTDAAFFPGTSWRSNFLCNLGFGDPAGLRPRQPRLDFDDACRIA